MASRLFVLPQIAYAYGCIYCLSGKETYIASSIMNCNSQIIATAVLQTKRRTKQNVTTLHDEIVFKGYILFKAPQNTRIFDFLPEDECLKVLTYSDGDWRLYGEDERYAKWVFRYDGLIGMSRAYRLGDRIHIIDGPLKDMEGCITRVDRRNKSGQVTITFGGRTIKIWLGFDIIEAQSGDALKCVSAQI
jgi:transcription termination/antitermination protein NusG